MKKNTQTESVLIAESSWQAAEDGSPQDMPQMILLLIITAPNSRSRIADLSLFFSTNYVLYSFCVDKT